MNRGVAKRVIFEDRADYRRFIFLLVCATRRGQLEVIAYSLMPNHFHLLVRSNGSLSEAMRRIQNDYSRWFNRRHRRDGPLIRGRFKSRPVLSRAYFGALLAYIDHNPVSAGICSEPSAYPWGSARFYATGEAPRWLADQQVFDHLVDLRGAKEELRTCYVRLFGGRSAATVEFVESELHSRRQLDHQLDRLLRARPARVRLWMLAKLRNADGYRSWAIVAAPSAIQQSIAHRSGRGSFRVWPTRRSADPWPIMEAAWRFLLAGQSQPSIALALGVSQSTVSKYIRWHKILVLSDENYAHAAAEVCSLAMRETFDKRDDL